MNETILIIDDDESMHIILKRMLQDEFSLLQANNAQEGIDILSAKPVDLVLSDIHMPGLSGLEFLESLMKDAEKKHIPVLIMTSLPTADKEQKALDLGAEDFIRKDLFNDHKEEVLDRIRTKIISNFEHPELSKKLKVNTKKLGKILMSEAVSGDFFTCSRKFCIELKNGFQINYLSQWSVIEKTVSLMMSAGEKQPRKYGAEELIQESAYKKMMETKEPYLCNHVSEEDCGILADFSEKEGYPAEIGIPLFALSEKKYLQNNCVIPEGTNIFGFLVFKRDKLFTTKEFEVMKKLFGRAGTIFWRLYQDI